MLTKTYATAILQQLFCGSEATFVVEGGDINQVKRYPQHENEYYYGELETVAKEGNAFFSNTGLPQLYLGLLTYTPVDIENTTYQEVDTALGYSRVPLHGKDIFNIGYILRSAQAYYLEPGSDNKIIMDPDYEGAIQTKYCITNEQDIVFPAPKANCPWNDIVGFGIFTTAEGTINEYDDLILWGTFDETIDVAADEILKINKPTNEDNDPHWDVNKALGSFVVSFG